MSRCNVLFQSVGTGRPCPWETCSFPFSEWEDEFKTLIFRKENSVLFYVCNVEFHFFSSLLFVFLL